MKPGFEGRRPDSSRIESLRDDALTILHGGLAAVEPGLLIERDLDRLRQEDSGLYDRFFGDGDSDLILLGAGKAVMSMGRGILSRAGHRIARGMLVSPDSETSPWERILIRRGGHPLPTEEGLVAANQLLDLARAGRIGHRGFIMVLSGGASSLLTLPHPPIGLDDVRILFGLLLRCGAGIQEINLVRKHLLQIAGGGLAIATEPAPLLGLILSDVPGDRLEVIGSGPTVADRSGLRIRDALEVLERYGLIDRTPAAILDRLRHGCDVGEITAFRGKTDSRFSRIRNRLIGSNRTALDAMARESENLGFVPLILAESSGSGPLATVLEVHRHTIAREFDLLRSDSTRLPRAIISGGEATVTVTGSGIGGRIQHFMLALSPFIAGKPVIAAGLGSDGKDGNSTAAGAIADGETFGRAHILGLTPDVFLERSDSHRFFKELGDLIDTGPTGTNVMDLRVILCDRDSSLPGPRRFRK